KESDRGGVHPDDAIKARPGRLVLREPYDAGVPIDIAPTHFPELAGAASGSSQEVEAPSKRAAARILVHPPPTAATGHCDHMQVHVLLLGHWQAWPGNVLRPRAPVDEPVDQLFVRRPLEAADDLADRVVLGPATFPLRMRG